MEFNELSEYIYFYREIINSFGAMRKNPARGSKVHVYSSEKQNAYGDAKKIQYVKNF